MRLSSKAILVLTVLILISMAMAFTGAAQESASNSTTSQAQTTSTEQQTTSSSSSNDTNTDGDSIAGIRPVSPDEFSSKFTGLVGELHKSGKPLVTTLSTFTILIGAVLLIVALFVGKTLFKMAAGILLLSGVGLIIFMNAETLTGFFLWISGHFQ